MCIRDSRKPLPCGELLQHCLLIGYGIALTLLVIIFAKVITAQSFVQSCILILGGKDKGNDYNEIADLVKEKCTGLIYMGLHNEKLHDFFDKFGLPVADVQSMKDAVDAAYRMAKKGETVLLSPCCASFDLFKSYEDRGEQFKECVRNL